METFDTNLGTIVIIPITPGRPQVKVEDERQGVVSQRSRRADLGKWREKGDG